MQRSTCTSQPQKLRLALILSYSYLAPPFVDFLFQLSSTRISNNGSGICIAGVKLPMIITSVFFYIVQALHSLAFSPSLLCARKIWIAEHARRCPIFILTSLNVVSEDCQRYAI